MAGDLAALSARLSASKMWASCAGWCWRVAQQARHWIERAWSKRSRRDAQDNDYATTSARWYDPTTGAFTAISGSPFANSGTRAFSPPAANHADGFSDWVLVLETQPPL
jgi:hypothetical protein